MFGNDKTKLGLGIKVKFASMATVCAIIFTILIGVGWQSLNQSSDNLVDVVNEKFVVLIDEDVTPLIRDQILPLINHDIEKLLGLQKSIDFLHEADKDAHQTIIAEKMVLVWIDRNELKKDYENELYLHGKNIKQLEKRVAKASAFFSEKLLNTTYVKYRQELEKWKTQTKAVVTNAKIPGKYNDARKSSDNGPSHKSFVAMTDQIDIIIGAQEKSIKHIVAQIKVKKQKINEKEKRVTRKKDAALITIKNIQNSTQFLSSVFVAVGLVVVGVILILSVFVVNSTRGRLDKTA